MGYRVVAWLAACAVCGGVFWGMARMMYLLLGVGRSSMPVMVELALVLGPLYVGAFLGLWGASWVMRRRARLMGRARCGVCGKNAVMGEHGLVCAGCAATARAVAG